ncbi:MAG: hypothetical protein Q9218_007054 [Villophora microphyllina]
MQRDLEIEYPKKPIKCILTCNDASDDDFKPSLLFTHGAGGNLQSDAIANFVEGFASSGLGILCFQGNMNLKSRVKMFEAVFENRGKNAPTCVGGRSMGARAAIMAAKESTTHYVLISYPLHTGEEVRDEILLDIPATAKVIFVSGDHDEMCQISRLDAVRKKMNCQTYRVIVAGADHGMNVKPKAATKPVGIKTGQVVAEWLRIHAHGDGHEGIISWDNDLEEAQWTGWIAAA